ncbi:prolyl oligopeptidase family serine peptidase [Haloprofundus sp. MHR1]|uniref:S9 family peptidase n=1 Tax=Haloprofundus sp. MHR1 TaxID=2572921 RepID=UPI0010BF356B|nr:prolyl oligopeptidase family serine peptidase [Haloprofundus sp. MHR1]QCJ47080.1 S9 family peptidase [Haloprofundus sp. MHR1]
MSDDTLLEELVNLPEITRPSASPDGERVTFYSDTTGRNEIFVLDVDTGEAEQWSDGTDMQAWWPLSWSADGERVFFHRDADGDEQNDIYALASDGATEPVVETDDQTNLHAVGTDGETLLVASNHERGMDLYRYRLPTDELERLTDHDQVWESCLSPNCERVAYAANESENADNRDTYLVDIDGANREILDVGVVGSHTDPQDWTPDGNRLLIADNSEGFGRCGVYDLTGGEVRWYGDLDYEESPACFSADGSRFLAERVRDAAVVPVVYDTETGEEFECPLIDGVAEFGWRSTNLLADDRVLLSYTTPTRPTELVAYDLDANDTETLFRPDCSRFSSDDFIDAAYLTVESDGVPDTRQAAVEHDQYETLEIGALFYDSGARPSPLLVNVHGGPRRADRKTFHYRTQYLLKRGYSILQVNFRGSSGRGRKFTQKLVGDFGGAEQGDIATVTEHVLETHDWLDAERVGVWGGSFGGYSTYWQMVQYPDLYAAGAPVVGYTDLELMYEEAMPQFRTGFMQKYLGTPEENPDLYRKRSPITHAENLAAPLLMAHGVNDRRVPVSQARVFRDALRERGYEEGQDKEFEYHEIEKRGHHTTDASQRQNTLQLFESFLDRRLRTSET